MHHKTMRQKFEDTASDFVDTVALPAAEKVRHTADDLIDKLGSDARHLGERVGEKARAQLAELPDAALKRLDLVTAKKDRRRTILGVLAGVGMGALLAYFFNSDKGAERRHALKAKLGVGSPQTAAAGRDLPR